MAATQLFPMPLLSNESLISKLDVGIRKNMWPILRQQRKCHWWFFPPFFRSSKRSRTKLHKYLTTARLICRMTRGQKKRGQIKAYAYLEVCKQTTIFYWFVKFLNGDFDEVIHIFFKDQLFCRKCWPSIIGFSDCEKFDREQWKKIYTKEKNKRDKHEFANFFCARITS